MFLEYLLSAGLMTGSCAHPDSTVSKPASPLRRCRRLNSCPWNRRLPSGLGRLFGAVIHPAGIMQAAKEKARVMAGRPLLRNKSRAQVDGL